MESEDGLFVFSDANGYGESEYPFLVFDRKGGGFIIADDYGAANDITAREFGITKKDAMELAIALLRYVKDGEPMVLLSNRATDVVDRVLERNKGA